MAERVDCVVIGAGVVGLAVARALAMSGREVIVLEAADAIGTETSSRNSEVIHAGIYYPKGSFKGKACVEGKNWLYDYCSRRGVPHANLGKLIVASADSQVARLRELQAKAADLGVELQWLDRREVERMEPAVNAVAGLFSPTTGVIDSHSLMLAYQGDAEDAGAMIAFLSPVTGGAVRAAGILLRVGGAEPMEIVARTVVNSAGLHACPLAASIEGMPKDRIPKHWYAKGNYFSVLGKQPFTHLVYPMPEASVLGVHVTLDLGGQCKFGPDLEWVDDLNYDVDPGRADAFYAAVRTYYPDLKDEALQPSYAGIRPKIHGPHEPQPDFMLQGPADHGVPGLINLFGIESPGLTSSPAIAAAVLRMTN
ncbi:MAG: NAD(P)/FAD-dependent oxidoreductase [Oceanicaulis sp.]|nr:NAD(P)/FAD-dependent oxidoreductase [Oceanicaulis sp.]